MNVHDTGVCMSVFVCLLVTVGVFAHKIKVQEYGFAIYNFCKECDNYIPMHLPITFSNMYIN